MVQAFSTIFFSASALCAVGVIAGSFGDNLGEIRSALGLGERLPALGSQRVRVRRVVALRGLAKTSPGLPLRAAA